MQAERMARRSFLLGGLAVAGTALVAGCGGGDDGKEITVTKQEDPSQKARDSMQFFKDNVANKKKGASKK